MFTSLFSLFVIVVTIAGIAAGRYPHLRMNRATIALVGAATLAAIGAISSEQAYEALDLGTLMLLLAMMIINANLRIAGFFGLVAERILPRARSPRLLLLMVMVSAGLLSALFLNDTIVLVFTPLLLEIVLALGRNPIPYLMGLATAANIGSAGAITGNPQNMLIGASSGIPYLKFSMYLMPVAIIGLLCAWGILILVYRKEFTKAFDTFVPHREVRIYRPLLLKSAISVVVLLTLFVAGVEVPLAAIIAASLLLVTRRLRPERVFNEIDWSLLVLFSGLFVVTAAIETSGWGDSLFGLLLPLMDAGVLSITVVTAALSNIISNVPAILLFRPLVQQFSNPEQVWLILAMASTFAGNLTLLGSIANLIVAETARRRRVTLSFTEYLKAGVPITLLTLLIGVVWFTLLF
jgi:Na+/H+ antiporter NhaD/arsenite permease-like protein